MSPLRRIPVRRLFVIKNLENFSHFCTIYYLNRKTPYSLIPFKCIIIQCKKKHILHLLILLFLYFSGCLNFRVFFPNRTFRFSSLVTIILVSTLLFLLHGVTHPRIYYVHLLLFFILLLFMQCLHLSHMRKKRGDHRFKSLNLAFGHL